MRRKQERREASNAKRRGKQYEKTREAREKEMEVAFVQWLVGARKRGREEGRREREREMLYTKRLLCPIVLCWKIEEKKCKAGKRIVFLEVKPCLKMFVPFPLFSLSLLSLIQVWQSSKC